MRITSVTAAEVEPEETRFLEDGRIPLGELVIVGGSPGRGKTQHAVGVCAGATRGTLKGDLEGQPVDAAFVSCEDSISRTLTPRFLAAGGDPERMHFFKVKSAEGEDDDPVLELPGDTAIIRDWLERTQARVLVLDPVIALIPSGLSGHKDQHVRRALSPLQRVLHELDVAGIALMHLTKDREADALNRLNGSVAFGAAARSVLLLAEDPDDPQGERGNQRILAHVKSNLGPRCESIAYEIKPCVVYGADGEPIGTSVLERVGESTYSANDLLDRSVGSGEATARDEARAFLEQELRDGPKPTNTLKTAAEKAGVAWRTVERAKGALRAKAVKGDDGWAWKLPNQSVGDVGDVGGLSVSTESGEYGGLDTDGGLGDLPNTANIAKTVTANGDNGGDLDSDTPIAECLLRDFT